MTSEHYIAITIAAIFLIGFLLVMKAIISPSKQKVDKSKYTVKKINDHFVVELTSEDKEARRKKKVLTRMKVLRGQRLQAELRKDEEKVKELEKEIKKLEDLIY